MSLTSKATSNWTGDLESGSGRVTLDSSKAAEFPVNWKARTEDQGGTTNPEELLGAAHAACYTMAFSKALKDAGHTPQSVQATAAVTFDLSKGGITGSHLTVNGTVPGISEDDFQKIAEDAKSNCPVSKALRGIEITLDATLSA
jgi:osmotically inducible protein OsmC